MNPIIIDVFVAQNNGGAGKPGEGNRHLLLSHLPPPAPQSPQSTVDSSATLPHDNGEASASTSAEPVESPSPFVSLSEGRVHLQMSGVTEDVAIALKLGGKYKLTISSAD